MNLIIIKELAQLLHRTPLNYFNILKIFKTNQKTIKYFCMFINSNSKFYMGYADICFRPTLFLHVTIFTCYPLFLSTLDLISIESLFSYSPY